MNTHELNFTKNMTRSLKHLIGMPPELDKTRIHIRSLPPYKNVTIACYVEDFTHAEFRYYSMMGRHQFSKKYFNVIHDVPYELTLNGEAYICFTGEFFGHVAGGSTNVPLGYAFHNAIEKAKHALMEEYPEYDWEETV